MKSAYLLFVINCYIHKSLLTHIFKSFAVKCITVYLIVSHCIEAEQICNTNTILVFDVFKYSILHIIVHELKR